MRPVLANLIDAVVNKAEATPFSRQFVLNEWTDVVDAWDLKTWEEYRDVARLGRRTRIGGKQREQLWAILTPLRVIGFSQDLVTWSKIFSRLAAAYTGGAAPLPFDFVVADEAQDLGVAEMSSSRLFPEAARILFLTGDLGQRIFQTPFSWKTLGVDVRRTVLYFADQLPHVASNQSAGRPAVAAIDFRR